MINPWVEVKSFSNFYESITLPQRSQSLLLLASIFFNPEGFLSKLYFRVTSNFFSERTGK